MKMILAGIVLTTICIFNMMSSYSDGSYKSMALSAFLAGATFVGLLVSVTKI